MRLRSLRGADCVHVRRGAFSYTAPTNRRACAASSNLMPSTERSWVNTPNETPKTGQNTSDSPGVVARVGQSTTGVRQLGTDFKNFILRGNVIDLAVAVIVGA